MLAEFSGKMTLSKETTLVAKTRDTVLVRFDEQFAPLWHRKLSATAVSPTAMTMLPDGGVCIGVTFEGTVNLTDSSAPQKGTPSQIFTSSGKENALIGCYAPDGEMRFAGQVASAKYSHVLDMASLKEGAMIVAGGIAGSTVYTNGKHKSKTINERDRESGFLARLDNKGQLVTSQVLSGKGNHHLKALRLQQNGSATLVGAFDKTVQIGDTHLEAGTGDQDIYLAGQIAHRVCRPGGLAANRRSA